MFNVLDFIKRLFKLVEVKAETMSAETQPQDMKPSTQLWPRLLFFRPSPVTCDEEPEKVPPPSEAPPCEEQGKKDPPPASGSATCEEVQEEPVQEEKCICPDTGGFGRKLGCMYHGARYGLKEGALTGTFFGGSFGIYKYLESMYQGGSKDGGGSEGGGSDDDNESTLNDNIIFVTAANGAIAMAVFCTLFCSTKAIIYCN